jgi:REP element-mobilizing transposase RayT
LEKLQPNTTYHIFNHANGFENVFSEPENYRFFLEKYLKYISPIAETYAYCLMPNHFHLVVRIRKRPVLEALILLKNSTVNFSNPNFSKVQNFGKVKIEKVKIDISDCEIEKYLSKQFANLFSSYTQAFNKVNHRMGSLFIKNFKRDPILSKEHFLNAVVYTHRNPIHHGFRENYDEWPDSSYFYIVHEKETFVETPKLLKIFEGRESFIKMHHDSLSIILPFVSEIP